MTTVKTFLVAASCGLVLLEAVAAQAMGLRYGREGARGPDCFESSDVRVIDAQRDIPFSGALAAVLVPTDSERACQFVGMIFDDETTLVVDCLHSDDEVEAFLATAYDNAIERVTALTSPIARPFPCPPPDNEVALEHWRAMLFHEYRPR